jgi:transposase InsO family protein
MDWYSRCITGLRLTPVSTKAIDAASVLYQSFRPIPAGEDWPSDAVWPPHGIPRSVLVEHEVLDPTSALAASPAIVPETIVVDHGKIYVGETLTSACRQMGISIQPARIREGRDKGPVERFFRTIREGFLQELPGYKGPDLYSRGAAPEKGAFLFIDEMEALLREWAPPCITGANTTGSAKPASGRCACRRQKCSNMVSPAPDTLRRPVIRAWHTNFSRSHGAPFSTTA